jgi:TolB protein
MPAFNSPDGQETAVNSPTHATVRGFVAAVGICVTMPLLAADPAQRFAPSPILAVEDAYPHVSREDLVVFQSNRSGPSKLFVAKLDGSGLRQLTRGASDDATPKWSFDGSHVAYASRGADGNEDIWIVDADGTNARNLTNHSGSDSHPSWSPDSRQIVFCSTRGDGENDDVYIVDVDGSGLTRLTDNGLAWDTFPSFSPDGKRILLRRLLRQRTTEGTLFNSEIMVMNTDGSDARNLSRDPFFDGWPAWSPNGAQIAFSSNRSDTYQIYVMNADGSNPVRVVESPYTDVRPQWLPDGTGLIFNREREGRIELWQVRLPGR